MENYSGIYPKIIKEESAGSDISGPALLSAVDQVVTLQAGNAVFGLGDTEAHVFSAGKVADLFGDGDLENATSNSPERENEQELA